MIRKKRKEKGHKIFILIILLSIMIISIKFLNPEFKLFDITILKVLSNSMEPIFKKGDFIIVKKESQYNIGDIITYIKTEENSAYYITHRIIKICEDGNFITKGDANNKEDLETVCENVIIGKVIFP